MTKIAPNSLEGKLKRATDFFESRGYTIFNVTLSKGNVAFSAEKTASPAPPVVETEAERWLRERKLNKGRR